MSTGYFDPAMLREYQDFAEQVQTLLRSNARWQDAYAGYSQKLLANKDKVAAKYKKLGRPKSWEPLCCYTAIGAIKGSGNFDFDLRFLGQHVGRIKVKQSIPRLIIPKETAEKSLQYFGCPVGAVADEDWIAGEKAEQFRRYYRSLSGQTDKFPRQKEHMVESALFSELGKTKSKGKTLLGIQPITCVDGVRLHMKTALRASEVSRRLPDIAEMGGGEIDIFCRRRSGNRSRLTVIEVKDENNEAETFRLAIKQAIAYAVFIRELARSQSGPDWMKLWGLKNQPWNRGFIINAVAAMPKGSTAEFPFAGMRLELKSEFPETVTDRIELHYIAFLGGSRPRDGYDMMFETSL